MAVTSGTHHVSSGSRSWNAVHRRGEVLRAVVDAANLRRDGVLPRDVPGVAETFADDFDLAAALQLRWHTRLAGTIDRMLLESPAEPTEAVVAAWHRTGVELVGVRQVLDAYAADPPSPEAETAFATARRNDWVLMAAMAGLAGTADEAAVHAGRALEQRARTSYDPAVDTAPPRHRGRADGRPTLLDRIRAALAA